MQQVNIVDVQAQAVTATLPAATAVEQVVGAGHEIGKVLATPERRLKYGLFPISYVGKPGRYQTAQGFTETHDWQSGLSTRTYNVVDVPLEQAIAQLYAKVDPMKERGQAAGVAWERVPGEVYGIATDPDSRDLLNGAVSAVNNSVWIEDTDYWTVRPVLDAQGTLGDPTDLYLTQVEVLAAAAVVFRHIVDWHQAARTHKEAIKLLADVDAVRTYEASTLGTGWPGS